MRRPAREYVEHLMLVPVAMLAYLIAETLPAPQAFWAWLTVAGIGAGAAHVPALHRRLTQPALIAASAAMLAAGVLSSWGYDRSLQALADPGRTAGWESVSLGIVAAFMLASALPGSRARSYGLWMPFLLSAQLCCMLFPGQYALVAIAALVSAVCLVVIIWPAVLHERVEPEIVANMGIAGALAVSLAVLAGFETPRMLFAVSHAPAAGLGAAAAATVALFAAAQAARAPSVSGRTIVGPRVLLGAAGAGSLWTLAAAILGATQLAADSRSLTSIHDQFQQGHTVISISWVLLGLVLAVASARGDRRGMQAGALALLFIALGKLFLYDLTFLTAMARAVSFIVSGAVLLLAALLLQRVNPHQAARPG
jgi:hypothetical protein